MIGDWRYDFDVRNYRNNVTQIAIKLSLFGEVETIITEDVVTQLQVSVFNIEHESLQYTASEMIRMIESFTPDSGTIGEDTKVTYSLVRLFPSRLGPYKILVDIDKGSAPDSLISKILSNISELQESYGGSGITFSLKDILEPKHVEV